MSLNVEFKVTHKGCPGLGALLCGAVEKRNSRLGLRNWSFAPEKVTCKRCLAMIARIKRRGENLSAHC